MAEAGQDDKDAPGFLGRWSRRKTAVLQGKAPDARSVAAAPAQLVADKLDEPDQPDTLGKPEKPHQPAQPVPALSLEDAGRLTKDSDFKPFMAENVGADVRNAAMKKLFTDPHFNVMDGLDIYIDDYSISDPIPESMLRQMVGSKLLKLFGDEDDKENREVAPAARESVNNPTDQTVAQSYENPDIASADRAQPENSSHPEPPADSGGSQENHAHTDLRLQPDHAAPAPDAGRGTR